MNKITPVKAVELSQFLGRDSYFANPFYLSLSCIYEHLHGEDVIFEPDIEEQNNSLLFLPQKVENIIKWKVLAYDEDLLKIEKLGLSIYQKDHVGVEYFYKTSEFLTLSGQKFKAFRKALHRFEREYQFEVFTNYPTEALVQFIQYWATQKDLSNKSAYTKDIFNADLQSCIEATKLLSVLEHKMIALEINKQLAGFSIFLPLNDNLWVGLMQKTDFQYRGITKYLYYLKAQKMSEIPFFTTGAEAQDVSLAAFKDSLHPYKKASIYLTTVKR